MTIETISFDLYSDLHKDVHGCRPRDWDRWEALSDAQRAAEFDSLCNLLTEVMDMEAENERRAVIALDARLDAHCESFGIDFATALRWEVEGADCDPACEQGIGFYLWENGIHKHANVVRYLDALGARSWRNAA